MTGAACAGRRPALRALMVGGDNRVSRSARPDRTQEGCAVVIVKPIPPNSHVNFTQAQADGIRQSHLNRDRHQPITLPQHYPEDIRSHVSFLSDPSPLFEVTTLRVRKCWGLMPYTGHPKMYAWYVASDGERAVSSDSWIEHVYPSWLEDWFA
jgi:hypothetical protein